MTAQFPGTQRADLQVVRDDASQGEVTMKALGLLENARKVADSTVAEARAEAERLLAAARERAAQVSREAKESAGKLQADAERESAQTRHIAYGESERILAGAREEVSALKGSVAGLSQERDRAESMMRELADRVQGALARYAGSGAGADEPDNGAPDTQGQQHFQ